MNLCIQLGYNAKGQRAFWSQISNKQKYNSTDVEVVLTQCLSCSASRSKSLRKEVSDFFPPLHTILMLNLVICLQPSNRSTGLLKMYFSSYKQVELHVSWHRW